MTVRLRRPRRARPAAVRAALLSLCCCLLGVALALPLALPLSLTRPAGAAPQKKEKEKKGAPSRKATRASLRGKLSSVSTKIRSVRTELKQAKRSEAAIAADLDAVRERLAATRARLADTQARLRVTRREQKKVADALAATQARLRERETTLARRMAADYRRGPGGYASVLLGARSMSDLLTRAYFVKAVVRYDAGLIAGIREDREAVLRWKAQVDEKARAAEGLRAELAAQQAEEWRDLVAQKSLLAEARARRAELEDEMQALAEDSARIAARLRALDATPAGRARRLVAFTGGFVRPVPGRVTSGYGNRFHPILRRSRLHTGVDMAGATGTTISAAASGTVVYSGRMRGYGNVVVIDHGGGVSTLYAHCSALLVNDGARVTQGQAIARVGSTGLSTGPHLHFEVRKNGSPVNPMGAF